MANMVEMSNFTFKIDKATREQYSSLCNELGLSMSAATLALIKQAVRNQSMSFSLRDENGFTPDEAAELMRRISEVRNNEAAHHDLIEA
jgi:putative toxin-antitoxin system protein